MIKLRKAANILYDARTPTAPISNPPSIVPPAIPTPTNRPFRIPEKIKRRKVALLLRTVPSKYKGFCARLGPCGKKVDVFKNY